MSPSARSASPRRYLVTISIRAALGAAILALGLAFVPGRVTAAPAGRAPARPSPARIIPLTTTQYSKSNIWSGYASDISYTGYSVTEATGTFTVRQVSRGAAETDAWVGVGGVNSSKLIQAGVNLQTMQAWYEMLPAGPVYVSVYPRSGDSVTVNVINRGTNLWEIYIYDAYLNQLYDHTYSYTADASTSDWIVEVHAGTVPSPFNFNVTYAAWHDNAGHVWNVNGSEVRIVHVYTLARSPGCLVPSSLTNGQAFSINSQPTC